MSLIAAPAAEGREASPIALVVILALLVAVVFLVRSMNKHLRKLPPTFADRDEHGNAHPGSPAPAATADRREPGAGADAADPPDPARP